MRTTVEQEGGEVATASEWGSERLDVEAYLSRIGFVGRPAPTEETLRALHRAHVVAIPFENLDILLGRGVPLDLDSLQDKLIRRLRGGYCYEHNLLFAALLDRLGFDVTRLAARVRNGSERIRPRTHMVLRVHAEDQDWLADVGFGGECPLEPVPLRDVATARQSGWTYRLDRGEDGAWFLRSLHADGWFDLYSFTLEPHHRVDYDVYNYYAATNPDSPFAGRLVVQRTGTRARHSLRGRELDITRADGSTEHHRLSDAEYPRVLRETFGIALAPAELARLPGGA